MRSIACWHFQWPWRTPDPVLKVTAFLKWTNSESFYRTLIGNHTQSIEWYHFQWPWVSSDPYFKVTTFFEVEYRKNGASERQSYYCTRGNYTQQTVWSRCPPNITSQALLLCPCPHHHSHSQPESCCWWVSPSSETVYHHSPSQETLSGQRKSF